MAVGLEDSCCLWKEPDGVIAEVCKVEEGERITSVRFDKQGNHFSKNFFKAKRRESAKYRQREQNRDMGLLVKNTYKDF